ncbi:MAG: hypothetical protein WC529_08065 [Candidatus Margulisiibacteriota bacterium]
MVQNLNSADQARQFIANNNVRPNANKQVNGQTVSLETDGQQGISQAEFSAYYADQVTISADAWTAIAGDNGVLDGSELAGQPSQTEEAGVPGGEVVGVPGQPAGQSGSASASQFRASYLLMSGYGRAAMPLPELEAKWNAALADDNMISQEEYADLVGVDVSDEVLGALFGGREKLPPTELMRHQDVFAEYFEASGGRKTWDSVRTAGHVNIIPSSAGLTQMFQGWSREDQLTFVQNNRDLLGSSFTGLSDEEVLDEMLAMADQNNGRNLRLLLTRVADEMAKELRKADIPYSGMNDPLTQQIYTELFLEDYLLTGELPTRDEMTKLQKANETLGRLHALYSGEGTDPTVNINPKAGQVLEVLDQVAEILDDESMRPADKRTEIARLLQGISQETVAVPGQ